MSRELAKHSLSYLLPPGTNPRRPVLIDVLATFSIDVNHGATTDSQARMWSPIAKTKEKPDEQLDPETGATKNRQERQICHQRRGHELFMIT